MFGYPHKHIPSSPGYSKNNDVLASPVRRPVVFEYSEDGWQSHSNVPGWSNRYVSNETWEEIMRWVHHDMTRPQVFSSPRDWMEYHEQNKSDNPQWDSYLKSSAYYHSFGLSLDVEVEHLLARTRVTVGPLGPEYDDALGVP